MLNYARHMEEHVSLKGAQLGTYNVDTLCSLLVWLPLSTLGGHPVVQVHFQRQTGGELGMAHRPRWLYREYLQIIIKPAKSQSASVSSQDSGNSRQCQG